MYYDDQTIDKLWRDTTYLTGVVLASMRQGNVAAAREEIDAVFDEDPNLVAETVVYEELKIDEAEAKL